MSKQKNPELGEADAAFFKTILNILILCTLLVGAISVNLAARLANEQESGVAVADLDTPQAALVSTQN